MVMVRIFLLVFLMRIKNRFEGGGRRDTIKLVIIKYCLTFTQCPFFGCYYPSNLSYVGV